MKAKQKTTVIAWDIETCPFNVGEMSKAQKRRYGKEFARRLDRVPNDDVDEASRLVRSVHPHLGWICCVSAVRGTLENGPRRPRSWTAEMPAGETELLKGFWAAIKQFGPSALWITFNGKRFDVPFLLARTVACGLEPTRVDLLDTHFYRHRPHADLACIWRSPFGLNDLCDLLSVPSSKTSFDGSHVAGAVAGGRLEEVARYCESDVVATFKCFRKVAPAFCF